MKNPKSCPGFPWAQGRAVRAQGPGGVCVLAAGPPRGCSVRLGQQDEPGCARHRPGSLGVSRVRGAPKQLFQLCHGDPFGKARPPHCSEHHRAPPGGPGWATLCINAAKELKILNIKKKNKKKTRVSGLQGFIPGQPCRGAASTRRDGRGEGAAPLLRLTGFPSSPISSAPAPGEVWGVSRGSVGGQ